MWGQGGVGKSTLLRQFRKIADEAQFATALTSDSETTVPEAMGRLADSFEQAGHKLTQFCDRYKLYRQKKQELESDPDAPQGFSAFVGKSIAKAGLGLAKQVPGSGAITPFLDEEAITGQAGEWASYVAKKLGNKDEVQLVNEPVEVLTPLFLQDLAKVAEKSPLVLFFDTYERTSPFLDSWLRELLEGRHGDLPANLLLVMAGREELDKNAWAEYEGVIAPFPLNPFTEEEATQYLHRKGITNPQIIEEILHLSGRLPLLVATLAAESPNDPAQIGDPSETAVERFLKWIDDPEKRQVAIDASLPRILNRDIIAVLQGDESADDLFTWLKSMPFIEQHPDGWAYHSIARTQMLRYKRLTSPQSWSRAHGKLADYYDDLQGSLQLNQDKKYQNAIWQGFKLEALNHRLCQFPQNNLSLALHEMPLILNANLGFSKQWAKVFICAGEDLGNDEVKGWGKLFNDGLKAFDEGEYDATLKMSNQLLNYLGTDSSSYLYILTWRGKIYRLIGQPEAALRDLNQAIKIDPNHIVAIRERGYTYRGIKCGEAAIRDFERLVELDPTYEALADRGFGYRLLQQYDKALDDFNRAIELNPQSSWALYLRGRTYRKNLARHEDALKDLNQAVEFNPNFISAISERGETQRQMGQYEEALRDFNRVIELNSKLSWAFSCRGNTHLMLGLNNEALMDFDRAIELKPESDWSLYCRALSYKRLNQLGKAKVDIEQAIQLAQQSYIEKPDDHCNTFNLAIYHLAADNPEQSKQFYRDALNRGASAVQIREAIRDLEDFLTLFPGHQAAQAFKQGLEKQVQGKGNE